VNGKKFKTVGTEVGIRVGKGPIRRNTGAERTIYIVRLGGLYMLRGADSSKKEVGG